jgi:hypothetical protein
MNDVGPVVVDRGGSDIVRECSVMDNGHYDVEFLNVHLPHVGYFDTEQHATQVARTLGNILLSDPGMRDHLTD